MNYVEIVASVDDGAADSSSTSPSRRVCKHSARNLGGVAQNAKWTLLPRPWPERAGISIIHLSSRKDHYQHVCSRSALAPSLIPMCAVHLRDGKVSGSQASPQLQPSLDEWRSALVTSVGWRQCWFLVLFEERTRAGSHLEAKVVRKL